MVTRSDPEKHKAQVRAANRARYKAVQLLIARHQIEFDNLYAEQALLEDVTPKPRERVDAAALQSQIAVLSKRLEKITNADADAPA
jgi:hypothetical protein